MKVLERDEWHHSLQIGNLLWMFNYAHGRPPGSCRRGGEVLISAWEKKVRINISKRGLAVLNSRQQVSRVRSATWPSAPNSHHSLGSRGSFSLGAHGWRISRQPPWQPSSHTVALIPWSFMRNTCDLYIFLPLFTLFTLCFLPGHFLPLFYFGNSCILRTN